MSKPFSSERETRRKAGVGGARKKSATAAPPPKSRIVRQGEVHARVGEDERHRRIEVLAYYRAERRGFTGGFAEQDWLDAEIEVDRTLGIDRDAT